MMENVPKSIDILSLYICQSSVQDINHQPEVLFKNPEQSIPG